MLSHDEKHSDPQKGASDEGIKLTASEPLSSDPFVHLAMKDTAKISAPSQASSSPKAAPAAAAQTPPAHQAHLRSIPASSVKRRVLSMPRGAQASRVRQKEIPITRPSAASPASVPEPEPEVPTGPSLRVVLESSESAGDASANASEKQASSKHTSHTEKDQIDLSGLPLLSGVGSISLDELVPDLATFSENFPKIPERLIFDPASRARSKRVGTPAYPGRGEAFSQNAPTERIPLNRNIGYNAPMLSAPGVQPAWGRSWSSGQGSSFSGGSAPRGRAFNSVQAQQDARNAYRRAGIRGLHLPDVVSRPRRVAFPPALMGSMRFDPMQSYNGERTRTLATDRDQAQGKSFKEAIEAFDWMLDPIKPPLTRMPSAQMSSMPMWSMMGTPSPWASPYLKAQFRRPALYGGIGMPGMNMPASAAGANGGWGNPSAGRAGLNMNGYGGANGAGMRGAPGSYGVNAGQGASANGYGASSGMPRSKPLLDANTIENSTIFDQPPIPIDVGMRVAETSHRRGRVILIFIMIIAAIVVGVCVTYVFSHTGEEEGVTDQTTEQTSSSSTSSSAAGSSNQGAGSVVYQYSALTANGKTYNVQETATFNDAGICEFTTMRMEFPDAATAKEFTDALTRDYGDKLTLENLEGSTATVIINNAGLGMNREQYEDSLSRSVEDLVVLKK